MIRDHNNVNSLLTNQRNSTHFKGVSILSFDTWFHLRKFLFISFDLWRRGINIYRTLCWGVDGRNLSMSVFSEIYQAIKHKRTMIIRIKHLHNT